MDDNDGGAGGDGGGANASARILQLECILASKDRELEVLRREYAGLGPSAEDAAAETARLRRRVDELEQRALLAAAAAAETASAPPSSSSGDPIARALHLSRQLERLLTLAASGSLPGNAAVAAAVGGSGGGGGAQAAAAAAAAPEAAAAPSSSAPAPQVVDSPLPRWMVTQATTGDDQPAIGTGGSSGAGTAAANNAAAATASHTRGKSSPELLRAHPALCLPPVLSLNVSGVEMDLLTASLAQLAPSSRLARMLATLEDSEGETKSTREATSHHSLPRDAQGRVFLPYPPDCFAAVLDMLHIRVWWPGGRAAGDLEIQRAAAAGSAGTSSAAAQTPAAPLLPETWRDRVSPARQAILRELIVELGLEALVADPRVRGPPHGVGGGSGVLRGPPPPPPLGDATQNPASVGDMYLRMAALGR